MALLPRKPRACFLLAVGWVDQGEDYADLYEIRGLSQHEWDAVDRQVIELIEGLDRGKEALKAFIEGMTKIN